MPSGDNATLGRAAGEPRPLHVLLIAESYPPSAYVGSVRPAALVGALRRAGHRVTVIRSALYAGPAEDPGADSLVTVLTVRARENPVRILARLNPFRALSRLADHPTPATLSRSLAGESAFRRIRRWGLSLTLLPDDSQGFVLPATLAALDCGRSDPIDLLITTGPPFSDHLAGLLLAQVLGVPWAVEFRDPWMPRDRRTAIRSALADWLEQGFENVVLRRSQLVVAVSASIAKSLDQKRLGLGLPGGVAVALNGVPRLLPEVPRPQGPIRVLHAGVLYLGRDPRPFLRALAAGMHAGRFGAAGVRVQFMGAGGGSFGGESVDQMAADLGIAECIEIRGQVPIEECRLLMAEADALLLLAQDQPTQIPNKLYDYLAARRPIVAYADAGGESAAILTSVGGHTVISSSDRVWEEGVVEALLASRHTRSGDGMSAEVLEGLRTERQMAPLVSALERLAAASAVPSTSRAAYASLARLGTSGAAQPASGSHPGRAALPPMARPGVAAPPLVSVVMPAWNVADYIAEAIASVVSQRYDNWELIVVNDGSPDTPALETAMAPYRDRMTYLVQENQGPGVARNTGLAAARGSVVAFLDGDDTWLPSYLESQVAHLQRHDLDMVYANAELIGPALIQGRTFMDLAPSSGQVTLEALLGGHCHVVTSGTVIRREALSRAGGFPDQQVPSEDFNTWLRVALVGARIGYQREPLLQYRMRAGSLTGDALQSARRGVLALLGARSLPLGERERNILERQLVQLQHRVDLEEAKQLVRVGDYRTARQQLGELIARRPRPRLLLVLLTLWLWPGLLRRQLERREVLDASRPHEREAGVGRESDRA